MEEKVEKRVNIILIIVIIVLCIAIGIPLVLNDCQVSTDNSEFETTVAVTKFVTATETTEVQVATKEVKVRSKSAKASNSSKATESTEKITSTSTPKKSKKTTKATETTETVYYATAAPVAHKASYDAQWNAGYLVAIDNPDKGYSCPHVELTDENREVLESLCMGEFSVGGFTGAALIAQAVKNAMVQYDIYDVRTIIKKMHYTGKLRKEVTKNVKDAVIYVFDMDKDAIQHRILYMYNPNIVQSSFHESQNYICTFKNVRFFDKK